jgi:hypothetical protein
MDAEQLPFSSGFGHVMAFRVEAEEVRRPNESVGLEVAVVVARIPEKVLFAAAVVWSCMDSSPV